MLTSQSPNRLNGKNLDHSCPQEGKKFGINTVFNFQVDASRTYKNKSGYKVGGYRLNTSFVTETHTPETFLHDIISQGWPYTMVHAKRSPQESAGILRNPKLTTPKHIENFISSQVLTFDDDSKAEGVIAFWLTDPFFSQYGWAFVESVNSKPGEAEKGHPTLILDQPITDPVLYKDCLIAFAETYPRLDRLTNIDRTIYNAEGARVHLTGNDGTGVICPFSAFETHILNPWRKKQAAKQAALQAKIDAEREASRQHDLLQRAVIQAHGRGQALSKDDAANPKRLAAFVAGRVKWIVEKLAQTPSGRHNQLLWAGAQIHALELAEWARPYSGAWAGVESAIVGATHQNGYFNEHAHSEAEVLRVFNDGKNIPTDPTPEPSQTDTPLHLNSYKKRKGVSTLADYTLADGVYLADVTTLDALPKKCILDAPTGTGKSTLATQGELVVLAVSTQLAADQLHQKNPENVGVFHGQADVVTGNMRVIACVYDSLPKLLDTYSFIDETWALVVDEQHNLALAGYRLSALDKLLGISHGRGWRQVVFMSGTPLDMPHGRDFERVTVRRETQRTHPAVFVNYAISQKAAVVAQIAHLHVAKGELVVVYLNNKRRTLNKLKAELAARGMTSGVYTLNADNKLEKAGRSVIENERLPEDCQVLICTAVLVESANLLNDVGAAIIASEIHPAYAHQFVSRARKNAPMCYVLNNGQGGGYGLDTRQEMANAWHTATAVAADIAHLEQTLGIPFDGERAKTIAGVSCNLAMQDDSGQWVASLLGVLQHVTREVTEYCWHNPHAFKRASRSYGWEWAQNLDYTETAGTDGAKQLTDQLNEQTNTDWLEAVKSVGELGAEKAALVVGAAGVTRRVINYALKISNALKDKFPYLSDESWKTAIGLLATAKDTGHSLKRLTRTVRLWTMEDDPALVMLYENAPLDTPLDRGMRYSLVIDTLTKDDQLRIFTRYVQRRTWEEKKPLMTEQNADELLESLFDVKKKRIVQDDKKVSVWVLTGKVDILARAKKGHAVLGNLAPALHKVPADTSRPRATTAVAQTDTPLQIYKEKNAKGCPIPADSVDAGLALLADIFSPANNSAYKGGYGLV